MDELDGFDPRLRWAETNREDISLLLIAKRDFEMDLKILSFLESGPKNIEDIAFEFKIKEKKVMGHLNRLRNRGVVFKKKRPKYSSRIYEVVCRPLRLKFSY